jgi:hypothetical protein
MSGSRCMSHFPEEIIEERPFFIEVDAPGVVERSF